MFQWFFPSCSSGAADLGSGDLPPACSLVYQARLTAGAQPVAESERC